MHRGLAADQTLAVLGRPVYLAYLARVYGQVRCVEIGLRLNCSGLMVPMRKEAL